MKRPETAIERHPVSMRGRSAAQWSNRFPLTPLIYEDLWRIRALSILSGRRFPVDEELELLAEALGVEAAAGGRILDAGCSTGLYARGLAARFPAASVVALDLSEEMLRAARRKAAADGMGGDAMGGSSAEGAAKAHTAPIRFVRADLADMPFEEGCFDGICMGGTLNELGHGAEEALSECRRVLKDGGVFFNMYLLESDRGFPRWIQRALRATGLRFWSREESEALFRSAGFRLSRMDVHGIVCFATMTAG